MGLGILMEMARNGMQRREEGRIRLPLPPDALCWSIKYFELLSRRNKYLHDSGLDDL